MSIVALLLFSAIFFLIQDEIRVAKRNADRYRAYCKKLIDENDSLLNHKPKETMKTLDQLIAETKGKFFSVTFTKKDGTERVMKCTTSAELVPIVESKIHVTNTDNPIDFPKVKKVNEDVMPVYDLESKAWKSFRWDSIKSVQFTIGEEIEHNHTAQ